MFLDKLLSRNPRLIRSAAELAMSGAIPSNSYVLDLDAIAGNGQAIRAAADRHGLALYWMLKQVGRNPLVTQALVAEGSAETVSVDVGCAHAGQDPGHNGRHQASETRDQEKPGRRHCPAPPREYRSGYRRHHRDELERDEDDRVGRDMALELNPDAVFLLGIAGTGCRIRRDDHEGGKTRQDRQQRAGFPTRDDGESRWRAVAIAAFFLMMGVTLVVPPTDAAVVAPLAAD